VERAPGGVEHGGEASAHRRRQPAEQADEAEQHAHDHEAEDHVEQQLLVRPPGALAAAAQIGGVSRGE
jgi:hypothetical protein